MPTERAAFPKISELAAHTGRNSIALAANSSLTNERDIIEFDYLDDVEKHPESDNYILKEGNCLKKFSPTEEKYIVSGWVKKDANCSSGLTISTSITVSTGTISPSIEKVELFPSGPVVDGWQRIFGLLEVDADFSTNGKIYVTLNNNENGIVYFDDIRIHPEKSNMKAFVYDPFTLRLDATLDENNYATFYEYDSEGKLIRVKKETEKGIVTLKEGRQELNKKPTL
jgi:hypothetical protein